MKRKPKFKRRKKYVGIVIPDIKTLDQREPKMDTRKGMTRQQETVNISFLEKQMIIDEFENLL